MFSSPLVYLDQVCEELAQKISTIEQEEFGPVQEGSIKEINYFTGENWLSKGGVVHSTGRTGPSKGAGNSAGGAGPIKGGSDQSKGGAE